MSSKQMSSFGRRCYVHREGKCLFGACKMSCHINKLVVDIVIKLMLISQRNLSLPSVYATSAPVTPTPVSGGLFVDFYILLIFYSCQCGFCAVPLRRCGLCIKPQKFNKLLTG